MKCGANVLPCLLLLLGAADRADAVIFLEMVNPAHHTSTPGDNSGWQYEGKFGNFMGVPIAPYFFISARHLTDSSVGAVFNFHGDLYTTIAKYENPDADLRIWEVDHAKPFPTYAPLSSGAADIGSVITAFGRGTRRGAEVLVSGALLGWKWGTVDRVPRWGRNVVEGTVDGGEGYGELLYCDFDNPGIADECHLSYGDSGGGMFVLEGGLWRLAGIHTPRGGRAVPRATRGDSVRCRIVRRARVGIRGFTEYVSSRGGQGRLLDPFSLLQHAHFGIADVDFWGSRPRWGHWQWKTTRRGRRSIFRRRKSRRLPPPALWRTMMVTGFRTCWSSR